MRTFSLTLALTLAAAFSAPAIAVEQTDTPTTSAAATAATGGYEKVFQVYSRPGESLESFNARMAPVAAEYEAKGLEVSGLVSADAMRYGLLVGNQPVEQAWPEIEKIIPTDMVPNAFPIKVTRNVVGGVPHEFVQEVFSNPGESLDDFVVRIAPIFDEFTARTEWEACGALAQAPDGRYGIRIGSIRGAMTCITLMEMVPEGMVSINKSVHSHPRTKTLRPTQADLLVQQQVGMRATPLRKEENGKMGRYFSDPDYNAGPGYLVHAGDISYQEGRGTARKVGKLDKVAKIRHFPQR